MQWPSTLLLATVILATLATALPTAAQCILANPSFELLGSGGATFGGWNQFGRVGSTTIADHGGRAARLLGPNLGGWDVSGVWQARTCAPGQSWAITGHVRHPSWKPLSGDCAAIVNVEWRDAGDNLISYESFAVAGPASPTDQWLAFALTSPGEIGRAHV